MITRADYMKDSENLHQVYYRQFRPAVDQYVRNLIDDIGIDKVREAYKADRHLNNIPLPRWYIIAALAKHEIARINEKLGNGRVWSSCDGVCAAKACARDIIGE